MKTLDEAIKHCEEVADECAIKQCAADHRQLAEWLRELKEYRENQVQNQVQEDNLPLSWDELKMLFHKPVWIETSSKKGWNIIVSIDNTDMQVIHTAHRAPKLSGFTRDSLGMTWNVYRKERE